MFPSFLITFREVIEASLIVATILAILVKLGHIKSVKTVWTATITATIVNLILLISSTLLGFKIQKLYSEQIEEFTEGILMIISALFITWAVFFLHNYFSQYKAKLLQKINKIFKLDKQQGLFFLVFTAVFREGFEIVLFLATVYFSANPISILSGFTLGTAAALLVSYTLFNATLRMPVFYAFRITSILLILFAAGLLARGVNKFVEYGLLPEIGKVNFNFIPPTTSFSGEMIKTIFGITHKMNYIQLSLYSFYTFLMSYWVFWRTKKEAKI